MRKFVLAMALAALASPALAAEKGAKPRSVDWSHSGPFGTFDRAELQRGFLVYREVCAACHGLRFIAFRNLMEIGLTEAEARVVAAEYQIVDGPDQDGEMFERPGRLSDYLPRPYPNEQAARAANAGAYPTDLSLIVKARVNGDNYLYSLLTGYQDPPAGVELREGLSYNPYFPGHQIAMPPPLADDRVTYPDGTPATVEQMSRDVTSFLAWAAEPTMETRKATGVKVMLFLFAFTGLMYAVKRKVWANVH